MAILFSKVTMRDDYNESEFFVSGFPQEPDDLEGWTAYHEFLDEITEDTIVNIHAVANTSEANPVCAELLPVKQAPTTSAEIPVPAVVIPKSALR